MECEKMSEELRLLQGLRELRKRVGDVDGGGFGVREQIGQAEEADRPALRRREDEGGAVALTAALRRRLWRRVGGAVHILMESFHSRDLFQMDGGKKRIEQPCYESFLCIVSRICA